MQFENSYCTLYYKVLFMIEKNQPAAESLQDIRQMMQRSSRFVSLSGLSGIAAGCCALAGAYIAGITIDKYQPHIPAVRFRYGAGDWLMLQLVLIGLGTLAAALFFSFFFTWQRSRKLNLPVWDFTSRRLIWNVMVPVITGGIFILGMLEYGEWRFVAPACLIFYGLGLINGSKYTLSDIRYLGYLEIILGLVNMFFTGKGLLFWSLGFGVLHILYGAIMWFKYEMKS